MHFLWAWRFKVLIKSHRRLMKKWHTIQNALIHILNSNKRKKIILKITGVERKDFLRKVVSLYHATSHLHNGNRRTSVGNGKKVSTVQKGYTVIIPIIRVNCCDCYNYIFKLKRRLVTKYWKTWSLWFPCVFGQHYGKYLNLVDIESKQSC